MCFCGQCADMELPFTDVLLGSGQAASVREDRLEDLVLASTTCLLAVSHKTGEGKLSDPLDMNQGGA